MKAGAFALVAALLAGCGINTMVEAPAPRLDLHGMHLVRVAPRVVGIRGGGSSVDVELPGVVTSWHVAWGEGVFVVVDQDGERHMIQPPAGHGAWSESWDTGRLYKGTL